VPAAFPWDYQRDLPSGTGGMDRQTAWWGRLAIWRLLCLLYSLLLLRDSAWKSRAYDVRAKAGGGAVPLPLNAAGGGGGGSAAFWQRRAPCSRLQFCGMGEDAWRGKRAWLAFMASVPCYAGMRVPALAWRRGEEGKVTCCVLDFWVLPDF